MSLRPNKIVPIYDYPDDKSSYIGKGILLERTFKNAEIQIWLVKELRSGKETQRVFYNPHSQGGVRKAN